MKKNKKDLSQSSEDYLETIYIIKEKQGNIRIKDIAKHLNVKLPSVTFAIKKLAKKNLVIYEKYGLVKLTKKGEEIAKNTYKKHKTLSEFFIKILKIDEKTASKEACKMEHGLSKKTLNKLILFINKMKGGKI